MEENGAQTEDLKSLTDRVLMKYVKLLDACIFEDEKAFGGMSFNYGGVESCVTVIKALDNLRLQL